MQDFIKTATLYKGCVQGDKRHKDIVTRYNSIRPLPRGYNLKTWDNWCAAFVSVVLYRCGVRSDVFECSAERMYEKFKKKKYIISDKTKGKKNDVIFFDWQGTDGWCDHVGFIRKVDDNNYYTIEGNKSKKCGYRTIAKNSKTIKAIGRIKTK